MLQKYIEQYEDCDYWEVSLGGSNSLEDIQSLVSNLECTFGVESVDTDELLSGWCDYRITIYFSNPVACIEEVCETLDDVYYDSIVDDNGEEVDTEAIRFDEEDDEEDEDDE